MFTKMVTSIKCQPCSCKTCQSRQGLTFAPLQSCAELRVEAVDYFQQDMTGRPVSQTAETLALVMDTTADAQDLQAAKPLLVQVCSLCSFMRPALQLRTSPNGAECFGRPVNATPTKNSILPEMWSLAET